ncbi:MAG: putative lipoic acid-binding regulatory protein [Gammaproteobacteria bacterium]|jgi:putative lipoic acid-binding regulatory protein
MKPIKAFTTNLLVCFTLFAITFDIQAAALYKWVDEDGAIRYTDRPPVTKKHQTLNAQGIVIDRQEAPKTKQELADEKEAKALARQKFEAEEAIKQARQAKDRVLLMTFSSEQELGHVRDNRIEVIESVIRLIDKSITNTEQQLIRLKGSAETLYLSKSLEIPGGLAQNIEHFTKKLDNRKAQLKTKTSEKIVIEEQYNQDLARFRFLKSQ